MRCICTHAKTRKEEASNRGERCIFNAYVTKSKAYRLYKQLPKKVIVLRDVERDEIRYG